MPYGQSADSVLVRIRYPRRRAMCLQHDQLPMPGIEAGGGVLPLCLSVRNWLLGGHLLGDYQLGGLRVRNPDMDGEWTVP